MRIKLSLLTVFLTSLLPGTAIIAVLPSVAILSGSMDKYWPTLFLTLPSLVIVPFLLASPIIVRICSKETIVQVGLLLYALSGICCILAPNIWLLILARGISGIAAGLVIPYTGALICDYFTGREREKLISYSGVIMYSGGIIILLLATYLVKIHWKVSFLVFLVALLPYVLIRKYLTNVEKAEVDGLAITYKFRDTIKFDNVIYITLLIYFSSIMIFYGLFINTSYIILDNNLGTGHAISFVQCIFMFFSIISNLIIALIKKTHLRLYIAAEFFLIAVAFIIISFAHDNIWYVYIGISIAGLGYGGFANMIINVVAKYTNHINRMNALALSTAMMYLGQFISPMISSLMQKIFNLSSYNALFFVQGLIILLIVILILFSYFIKIRRLQKHLKLAEKELAEKNDTSN